MSTTNHLVCDECKEYVWIGQGPFAYRGEPRCVDALFSWLNKHYEADKFHTLRLANCHDEEHEGYKEIPWPRNMTINGRDPADEE